MWHVHNVQKERDGGVLWNGQKAGGLSLRVKRDERVGVWWLDGVDVCVMAWCQTLCHCQCQPHQPHPSMVSHSPVCFKSHCVVATSISVLVLLCFFHNQNLWVSASEPAGSMPSTQSQKREVGTIALWPQARVC